MTFRTLTRHLTSHYIYFLRGCCSSSSDFINIRQICIEKLLQMGRFPLEAQETHSFKCRNDVPLTLQTTVFICSLQHNSPHFDLTHNSMLRPFSLQLIFFTLFRVINNKEGENESDISKGKKWRYHINQADECLRLRRETVFFLQFNQTVRLCRTLL
ncbi:hypothetical protein CEXT_597251 [Caerostris extrusa]|uniref:Uncharacterized protein n=1 Tax=Caerostris extrusa TaxID=172846 RepID=A0AAV4Q6G2_CAEEX|nr:hypothetical protein CEXT_597251 [Caerostris extrusa]